MPVDLSVAVQPLEPMPPGDSALLTLDVKNNSSYTDQYLTTIDGLEPAWFDEPASLGLFPGDQLPVTVKLHPPNTARPGKYPFRVHVRGRGGGAEEFADSVLVITGTPVPSIKLEPLNASGHRQGSFQVVLRNSGDGEAELQLTANDAEEACAIDFPGEPTGRAAVAAMSQVKLAMRVRPRSRPWVGKPHTYGIDVKAVDARSSVAAFAPLAVRGSYTHLTFVEKWSSIVKPIIAVCALVAAVFVVRYVMTTDFYRNWHFRLEIALSMARAGGCQLPLVQNVCPANAFAASTTPDTDCTYASPFKEFYDADPRRIGVCRTDVGYDGFGNGLQESANGVLFWQRDSNTVFFFDDTGVTALLQGAPIHLRDIDAR